MPAQPRFLFLVSLSVAVGLGPQALADAPESSESEIARVQDPAVEVEEVLVTGTRTKEHPGTVPGAHSILTREEIDLTPFHGGHQTDDLLRYVPGIQPSNLSSRYNHPTAQAVSVRGLGSRRALVLLDNIPLNDGFGGWINWGMVPDHARRVEVMQGGVSNLYGTWAMGGAIHILTDQPGTGGEIRFDGGAGNLDTYTTSLYGRYGTNRLGIGLGYRWFHTNGFVTVPRDQRGPVDTNDDSRHQQFSGTLAFAVSTRTQLTITGNYFREDRSFGTPLSLASRTIGTAGAGMEGRTTTGYHWETKAFAQWQTFRNLTSQVIPSPTVRLGELRDRIQVIPSNDFGGLMQVWRDFGARHRLVVGGDARGIIGQSQDDVYSIAGPIGRTLARGKQVGWGIFAEWIATPLDGLTVIPSVRTDWWKNFDGQITALDGTVTAPRDNVETALNPKLAFQHRLTSRLTVAASVYQAFRAPTLNELYRGFGFAGFTFLPNSSLTPERLWGTDGTVKMTLLPQGQLALHATGHYDEVRDQIIFVSQGPVSAQRQNVGRTRTIGAEIDMVFRPSDLVTATAGYAYADSTIRSFPPNPSLEGNRVPNVSRHQVVARASVGHPDMMQMTVMGRYLSRQYANDLNTQPIADFVVLDASLRKNLGKRVQLFLDAENLTDRQYIATQTGAIKTLGAPRLIIGGIRLRYQQ